MPQSLADREIVMTRVIGAPRALVFAAFTDKKHISNWWGPHGFATTTHEMNVRPGGVWRFTMHGPDGTDYENLIVYREVTKPLRLVYDHSGIGHSDDHKFQSTITFDERGGKTFVTLRLLVATSEQRETLVKFGAVEGGHQTLERLDQHLAESAAGSEAATAKAEAPVFVVKREFKAPRHLVWAAHSTAEHLAQWWGPQGCKLGVSCLEHRPGGLFHYSMTFPNKPEMWGRFIYRDVVPQRRMVYLSAFSNPDCGITRAPFGIAFPMEVLNTLTLSEEEAKTTMTLTATPFGATDEERAVYSGMFASMQNGFGATYDQLDQFLAQKLRGVTS